MGGGGNFMLLLAFLYTNIHFDLIVFDFVKCVEGGGSGGPPPEKFGFKWCKIVQFYTPETWNCSLKMPGMLN